MKLKKQTRLLMLTASAVAVVGVAAVSFAAWTGSNTELTANASTGYAYLEGFSNNNSLALGSVVPFDQENESIKGEGKQVVTADLPTFTTLSEATLTVKNFAFTETVTGVDVYVWIGAKTEVGDIIAQDNTTGILTNSPTAQNSEWKKVDATTTAEFTVSLGEAEVLEDQEYVLAVTLVSSLENKAATDVMDQAFSFTVAFSNTNLPSTNA